MAKFKCWRQYVVIKWIMFTGSGSAANKQTSRYLANVFLTQSLWNTAGLGGNVVSLRLHLDPA